MMRYKNGNRDMLKMLNIINHWGMLIKTTMRCHLSLVIMATTKKTKVNDVEKRKPWHTVSRNVNRCINYKNNMQFLREIKIDMPFNLSISLVGFLQEK